MSNQRVINNLIDFIKTEHGKQKWTTVYEISERDQLRVAYYSSFVKKSKSKAILKEYQWDVSIGHGFPTIITEYKDEKTINKYHRHSYASFPPLVIARHFGVKEPSLEIAEEFRLFHNLYFDTKKQVYLSFDEAGDEIEVVRVTSGQVQIKTNYLYKFMIEAKINLVLYFDCTFSSPNKLEFEEIHKTEELIYSIYSGKIDEKYFSLLMGKKLINYGSVAFPSEPKKNYQEFYVGGDEVNPKMSTCNPEKLDDLFIRKPNATGHYLTPVFFKKEVLTHYFNNSSEYTVTESTVSRKGAWHLHIDNQSADYLSVYLGDLGGLPAQVQTYWKSFNLIPDGHAISQIYYERTMQASFVESTRSDHVFKKIYSKLSKAWHQKFGWYLFKPLSTKDRHHLDCLRYMLTEEQSEFDLLIGSLAKILNDSVNCEQIEKLLGKKMEGSKSIILLEDLFIYLNFEYASNFKIFLQKIQTLRSTGVAHRKGKEYDKAIEKYNIPHKLSNGFNNILLEGADLLNSLYEILPKNSIE
ncbi:hypothetical protein [Legionella sainthelensi]|uniref:hypothetical protein n=1 Tax=Legionella sainthelensi TaxID=28087 RepID=UPI000E2051DF|nr:hypothetical protein [Legionella sainthelensi]